MTPDDIRAIRAQLNLTQEALANRLGLSVHTVRSWEHGDRAPGSDATRRLQLLATSPVARARHLTETLEDAAALAERNAEDDIAAGDPESAEIAQRLAGHLRRLASNHRDIGVTPPQVAPLREG